MVLSCAHSDKACIESLASDKCLSLLADLYKNGIQRDSFLPFIAMLKAKTVLVNLNSGIDYRLTGTVKDRVYFWPLSTEATNAIDELFAALTQGQPKCTRVLVAHTLRCHTHSLAHSRIDSVQWSHPPAWPRARDPRVLRARGQVLVP